MTKNEVLQILQVPEIGSDAEKKLERILSTFTDEDIRLVIENPLDISLSYLFLPSVFSSRLNELKAIKKMEEMSAKMPRENETAKSLDLLGTALIEAIKQTKGAEIVEDIKTKLDAYVVEKYPGIQTKQVILKHPETGKKLEAIHHEKFEYVLSYVVENEPVMLLGPAGTGKNVICEQIAELMGYEYHASNAVQQPYQLEGFIDANGRYQPTEFYKACKTASEGKDALFVFDEIDASNPDVLTKFNNALSSFTMEFPNETISFKDHLHVMACANTWGTGASAEYVGRNVIDAATRNRFAPIQIDYSPTIEESLCEDKELLSFLRQFRKAIVKNHLYHIVSYRDIKRTAKMMSLENIDKKEVFRDCVIGNMEADDIRMVVRDINCQKYRSIMEEIADETL